MSYSIFASVKSPMLVIYLLDASGSMASGMSRKSRVEVLNKAIDTTVYRMFGRSRSGEHIRPRYKIAMIAYNDTVFDIYNGIISINELVNAGLPEFTPGGMTNTALAFEYAEKLLKNELPKMDSCPPPLICHVTDGEYTGDDPEPIANRIMNMAVPDGNVLVQNIYINDDILENSIPDVRNWKGISAISELNNEYAKKLYLMSSVLPDSYRETVNEMGYNIEANIRMMIPAVDSDILSLGFAMSASTPFASFTE